MRFLCAKVNASSDAATFQIVSFVEAVANPRLSRDALAAELDAVARRYANGAINISLTDSYIYDCTAGSIEWGKYTCMRIVLVCLIGRLKKMMHVYGWLAEYSSAGIPNE